MSTITDLREHLMDTLASLRDRDNPMDVDRARAVAQVAGVLFNAIFLDQLDGDALHLRQINELIAALIKFTHEFFGSGESALISRTRHRTLLQETATALSRAKNSISLGDEIVAEELRIAIHSLGRLTGRVDVEDILDVIFREFCIGK